MIELRNSVAQIIQPGQAVTFDTLVFKSGNCECWRKGTGAVRVRPGAVYEVGFNGNISGTAAGTPVQLAIALGGQALPETVMVSTPSTANAFNNVGTGTFIRDCCCDADRITVINTGTVPVLLSANMNLRIKRLG